MREILPMMGSRSGVRYVLFRTLKQLALAAVCICVPAAGSVQAQSTGSGGELLQLLQSQTNSGGITGNGGSISLGTGDQQQQPVTLHPEETRTNKLATSRLEEIMSSRANVKLSQFGYDQLGSGQSITVPQAGAIQDNYVLGTGDEIVIALRGQDNSEYRVSVNRDGQIVIPRLAPIPASGRTLGDLREAISNAVRNAYVSTQVFVSVGRIRQVSVIVSGEVNNPGAHLVTGLSSPVDAILLSGGIKKTGSLRNIKLLRAGKRITIDLYSILTQAGGARSILLTDGDTIIVPPLGRTIAVAGWVRRQGIYELPPGQEALTVRGLISLAGGLEVRGRYNLSVLRLLANGSSSLVSAPNESALVRDGEILFVKPSAQQSVSQATLSGATALAGQYAVGRATKLSNLLRAPGALGTSPYTLFGVIVRRDPMTQMSSLIPFAPVAVLSGRQDAEVKSDDVVRVFTVKEAALVSAVITQFQKLVDRFQNQNQLDTSEIEKQTMPSGTASTSDTDDNKNASTGDNANDNNNTPPANTIPEPNLGGGERNIISSLVAKTINEAGVLSDRPATNENFPFGITRAQGDYLLSQQRITNPQSLDQRPRGSEVQSNNQSVSSNPEGEAVQSSGNANARQPQQQFGQQQNFNNGLPGAPNMEAQQVASGQIPTNTEVQTFGQLSRQLGVDPLVLIHFLMDHDATVGGSIRGAGLYLVGPDVTMNDMITAAGGLNEWTDKSSFEVITTAVESATGQARTEHQLLAATDQTLNNYIVKPKDEVRFNGTFTNVGIGTVTIKGQVRDAGTFHIERGERLSELLLRAGGLTDQAYPYGTIFMRKSAAASERDGYRRLASDLEDSLTEGLTRTGNQHLDATTFSAIQTFVTQLRNTPAIGRITAIADPAVLAADPSRDTVLEPGDVVFIPQRPSTVAVLGQVMQPGNLMFSPKFSVKDYIDQAGGYGQFADDSRTYLVLPDGSARRVETSWLNLDDPNIPPGSTLVVPRDLAPFDLRQTFLDTVSILSSFAVTAASLAVLRNQ